MIISVQYCDGFCHIGEDKQNRKPLARLIKIKGRFKSLKLEIKMEKLQQTTQK